MPLQVKLIAEGSDGVCAKCGRAYIAGNLLMAFHIFAEGGTDKTEAVCCDCLKQGAELSATIELPDLSPGRQPPSRQLVKRTRKEERELASRAGGRRQPASGALPGLKGDGVLKGVARWDSKMCLSKKVSWDFDDLIKIRSEAAYGEIPAIITAFTDRHTHQVKERWVTIPYETWEEKIIHAADHHQ